MIRFHWLRVGVAAFSYFALISLNSSLSETAPGRILLLAMLGMNLYFVTWGGALLFAPVIAEEKEAGTLGLLRMTGIGPAALILGSFLPKLIQIGLILVVQFPMFCLTVTLGGVDWSHVWAAVLVIATQLVFVASGSVLSSVLFRTSGRAIAGVIVASLLWSNLSRPVLGALGGTWTRFSLFHHVQLMQGSGASSQGVELAVALHLGLSVGFLLLAIGLFDRFNLHEVSGEPAQSLWQRCRTYFRKRALESSQRATVLEGAFPATEHSSGVRWGQRPAVAVWQNSLAWKEFTFLGGGRFGFWLRSGVAIGGLLAVCTMYDAPSSWVGESILNYSLWVLAADLIYLTVNLFGVEVRSQTWETLQTLPVPLGVICRQKILGAAIHLIPWTTAAAIGAGMAALPGEWMGDFVQQPFASTSVAIHLVSQIAICSLTLTHLSLRWNPWVATLVTAAVHLGIYFGVVISALMTFGLFGPPAPPWKIVVFNLLWFIGALVYVKVSLWAIRRRLDPGGVEW